MKLTANRVVLLLHSAFIVATAVAVFLAAINNSLPHAWQASVAAAITIITAVAGGTTAVIKFLDGSQKFDQLTAHSADMLALHSSAPVEQASSPTVLSEQVDTDLETGPDEPLEPENLNADEWLKVREDPAPAEPEAKS